MGWTWTHSENYTWGGTIDRKAECDALYTWNNEETGDKCRVLKSAMVGTTWYGACERTRPGQQPYVFAGVCLTSVDSREYCILATRTWTNPWGRVSVTAPSPF